MAATGKAITELSLAVQALLMISLSGGRLRERCKWILLVSFIFAVSLSLDSCVSVVLADSCTKARQNLDELRKDYEQSNRNAWLSEAKLLYKQHREKIDGELSVLNSQTQTRLKAARNESERAPIRKAHHERRSFILQGWLEYHRRKQDLDRKFRERHFAMQDAWYEEIWQLRKTADCGYGTSRFSRGLRKLLEKTQDVIDNPDADPKIPPAGGIRG